MGFLVAPISLLRNDKNSSINCHSEPFDYRSGQAQ